jgi:uncharacterized membrane protein
MLKKSLVLALLSVFPIAAKSQYEPWGWDHMGAGGMFFGWMMWFWIALIVVVAIWFAKSRSGKNGDGGGVTPTDDTALTILKKRLANGEIDENEYLATKKTLES